MYNLLSDLQYDNTYDNTCDNTVPQKWILEELPLLKSWYFLTYLPPPLFQVNHLISCTRALNCDRD